LILLSLRYSAGYVPDCGEEKAGIPVIFYAGK
jgi:hypothetical protein